MPYAWSFLGTESYYIVMIFCNDKTVNIQHLTVSPLMMNNSVKRFILEKDDQKISNL